MNKADTWYNKLCQLHDIQTIPQKGITIPYFIVVLIQNSLTMEDMYYLINILNITFHLKSVCPILSLITIMKETQK